MNSIQNRNREWCTRFKFNLLAYRQFEDLVEIWNPIFVHLVRFAFDWSDFILFSVQNLVLIWILI